MEDTLKLILSELQELKSGQADINVRLGGIDNRLDTMQADIDQIKEDTEVTRDATNVISKWTELAAVNLQIEYPVKRVYPPL